MADSVKRIEKKAFRACGLSFIKLSRNLEYIGEMVFNYSTDLTSIFIPPSCREIGKEAFSDCWKLTILHVPQRTQLGEDVIVGETLLYHDYVDDLWSWEINEWIKSQNQEEEFKLHRECASCNPTEDVICGIIN